LEQNLRSFEKHRHLILDQLKNGPAMTGKNRIKIGL